MSRKKLSDLPSVSVESTKMEREKVFEIIANEREYQDFMSSQDESYVTNDFPLSAALEAIRYLVGEANSSWYKERTPYPNSMESIRKIAAVCVQMGEKYGMKPRKKYSTKKKTNRKK